MSIWLDHINPFRDMKTTQIMKLVLLLWFLLCSGVSHNCALANPISREQALQNARDFFAAKGKTLPERSFRHAPVKNGVLTVEANYFVFNVTTRAS